MTDLHDLAGYPAFDRLTTWLAADDRRTCVLCRAVNGGRMQWFCRLLTPVDGSNVKAEIRYGEYAEETVVKALEAIQ